MPRVTGRPGASLAPLDFNKLTSDLQEKHPHISNKDVMSAALYPSVTEDYLNFREQYGPVDKIDTRIFLVGPKVGEEFEVSSLSTGATVYLPVQYFSTPTGNSLGGHSLHVRGANVRGK